MRLGRRITRADVLERRQTNELASNSTEQGVSTLRSARSGRYKSEREIQEREGDTREREIQEREAWRGRDRGPISPNERLASTRLVYYRSRRGYTS